MLTPDYQSVVQLTIETWQFIIGIVVIVFGIGCAWGTNRNDIKWIKNEIKWIKEQIDKIWDSSKVGQSRKMGAEGAGSPVNPTELGWKYLRESGLADIVDKEKREELLNFLKKSLAKNYTDYDVQEMARRVVVSIEDISVIKPIKDYAFQNGLDADMILRLGGLLLRDNFLGREHQTAPSPNLDKK